MNDDVESVKRRVRLSSRETGTPHRKALDQEARRAGHSDWGAYARSMSAGSVTYPWDVPLPPRLAGILSDPGTRNLALDPTRRLWTKGEGGWTERDRSLVEGDDALEAHLATISTTPSRFVFTTCEDVRLCGAGRKDDTVGVHISLRKPPANPRMILDDAPSWSLDVFEGDPQDAIDVAMRGLASSSRLVSRGLPTGIGPANRLEVDMLDASLDTAVDFMMRADPDAIVMKIGDRHEADMAIQIARSLNGRIPMLATVSSTRTNMGPPDVVLRRMLDDERRVQAHGRLKAIY